MILRVFFIKLLKEAFLLGLEAFLVYLWSLLHWRRICHFRLLFNFLLACVDVTFFLRVLFLDFRLKLGLQLIRFWDKWLEFIANGLNFLFDVLICAVFHEKFQFQGRKISACWLSICFIWIGNQNPLDDVYSFLLALCCKQFPMCCLLESRTLEKLNERSD